MLLVQAKKIGARCADCGLNPMASITPRGLEPLPIHRIDAGGLQREC